jgi:hypothetical protein
MTTRRNVLKTISAAAICSVVQGRAEASATEDINLRARQIGEAMRELHGGVWRISIDKDFVLISKQLVIPSSAVR